MDSRNKRLSIMMTRSISSSCDSQLTNEEIRFLDACIECDDDALYDLVHDGLTYEEANERDKSGRTGMSHACANGFMPILELLVKVEEVDPNLEDNDGNTPLIFAAQAGHEEVVSYLLRHFPHLRIDHANNLGFTALMKAAIQGRTKTAKLLLFAGANPNRRDSGRRLCASEWARFCGRHSCADAIEKYIRSKKYILTKAFFLSKEKWNSEPELAAKLTKQSNKSRRASNVVAVAPPPAASSGKGRRDSLGWIQRHLSLKKRGRTEKRQSLSLNVELQIAAIAGSAPMLVRSSSTSHQESHSVYEKSSQDVVAFCSMLANETAGRCRPVLPTICITTGDSQMLHEGSTSAQDSTTSATISASSSS